MEAEHYVRHNWSDVAIHDRRKLQDAPVGHYHAWIIGEFGSYFTPLYCDITAKEKWERSPLAPIQILCMRWLNKANPLAENKSYMRNVGPFHQECYIICKTDDCDGGSLDPVKFVDLMDLALIGTYKQHLK